MSIALYFFYFSFFLLPLVQIEYYLCLTSVTICTLCKQEDACTICMESK